MPATVIVDAFWGDAGKGKFSAYLSTTEDALACVRAGIGPNAGHSIYRNGVLTKTRIVPLGLVNPRTRLFVGSGVAIDPRILLDEIASTRTKSRLRIDERCPVIQQRHIRRERHDPVMRRIDSTMTGAGAARADYVMRRAKRAHSIRSLEPFTCDVARRCNDAAAKGRLIIESSQATHLSLYLSKRYPYTTSDNCTTTAFVDDVGLNWQHINEVLLLVKCLPTAVGEGPLPNEMPGGEIARRGLVEFGVNTGRPRRRVRSINESLLRYSVMVNGPTAIALTWCDQFDARITGRRKKVFLTSKLGNLAARIERITGIKVRYLDTGKEMMDVIEL